MRHGIAMPVDWKYLGAVLANEGSVAQVDFFKSFLDEMRSWGTNHQIELQLISIAKELSGADRGLLSLFCDQHGGD